MKIVYDEFPFGFGTKFSNLLTKHKSSEDMNRYCLHVFGKYVGKYFAAIVPYVAAYVGKSVDNNCYIASIPMNTSQYEYDAKQECGYYLNSNIDAILVYKKEYLRIYDICVGDKYGSATMMATDAFGKERRFEINVNNVNRVQFKEISEAEYMYVQEIFSDDREEVMYTGKRVMSHDEKITDGRYTERDDSDAYSPAMVNISIMAKSYLDAYEKYKKASGIPDALGALWSELPSPYREWASFRFNGSAMGVPCKQGTDRGFSTEGRSARSALCDEPINRMFFAA